jgi:hypothetical protein
MGAMEALSPALVLYADNPAATRRFYETLGLAFQTERHATGPEHVACDLGGFVLEIYPFKFSAFERGACRHVRLVIPVSDLNAIGRVLTDTVPRVHMLSAGGNLLVNDPDGVTVILFQR